MQHILKKIKEILPELKGEIELEIPPETKMGDFALPCFAFVKKFKKKPADIAKDFANKIPPDNVIAKVQALGPYVNFFLQPGYIFQVTCEKILKQKNKYGNLDFGKNKKVLVEYSGPNTNKPLHLGHARNNVLGMALINILEANGYKVIKADIVNDRGVHINKSVLAYQKWGYGKTPMSEHKKSDHFVGDYYVLYDQMKKESPEIEEEIKEMLKKWEAGDKETLRLWKKMRQWALDGIKETYKRLGSKFDVTYYESDTYKEGKKYVLQGLKNKIFKKEKGAIIIDLTKQGLDKKVLLRSNGTALYITQDIAASKKRFDQYKPDKAIWVVGSEQEYHFKVLFEILEQLKIAKKENLYHLSYGMVNLTSGKMKSREGTVVDIDNLMDELHEMAKKEITKRDEKISKKELDKRAETIGLGALKYYLIKSKPKNEITFNPAESVSFDGNTGPYIQYAYARIQSIIKKSRNQEIKKSKTDFNLLGNLEERTLINLLAQFPQIIEGAAEEYNPSKVANFIYDLAKSFNNFYHQHSVLSADDPNLVQARLKLAECVGIVLKKGLGLLGINVIDRM
jgi:arginyl-tRNA synthetase